MSRKKSNGGAAPGGQTDRTAADQAEGERVAAEQAEAERVAAEQAETSAVVDHLSDEEPSEANLTELGLVVAADGLVTLSMLVSASGFDFCHAPGDEHRCDPAEAVRFVRRGYAKPGSPAV